MFYNLVCYILLEKDKIVTNVTIKHTIYYRELHLLIFYCSKSQKKCPRTDAPGHSLECRLVIRLQAQHFCRKEPTTI